MRNLIPDLIIEKYLSQETDGEFLAVTMFLDISGFTTMAERLLREGKEGADILSATIKDVLKPVIEKVYRSGGFIAYFAGTAFTAIFPGSEQSLQAAVCAVEINRTFNNTGKRQTKFGEFQLFIKLGISFGKVEWEIDGNQQQQTCYFRGKAIDGCADSEHQARKFDIIFDDVYYKNLPKNVRTPKLCLYNGFYRLINCEYKFNQVENNPTGEILPEILQKFIPDLVLSLELKRLEEQKPIN